MRHVDPRRKYQRLPCGWRVTWTYRGTTHDGTLADVSAGGLCLRHHAAPPSPGRAVDVQLASKEGAQFLASRTRVMWAQAWRFGVEFVGLDGPQVDALVRELERCGLEAPLRVARLTGWPPGRDGEVPMVSEGRGGGAARRLWRLTRDDRVAEAWVIATPEGPVLDVVVDGRREPARPYDTAEAGRLPADAAARRDELIRLGWA